MTDDNYVNSIIQAAKIASANLTHWTIELILIHDEAKSRMEHEDDYQNGYLHGLNTAIEYLRARLPEIEQHEIEMRKYLKGEEDNA